jgi:3-phosphoshikimate 1-carboxyvinyltransferase
LSRAAGTVRLPGSKSISNRMLLLSALAAGSTEIHDLLDSDDTGVMLAALRTLGAGVEALGNHAWRIRGVGGAFPVKSAKLFLGNAGTAFRPLTAALAVSAGHYVLSGVPRMHERPIGDLVDGLHQIGADVGYLGQAGYPPLEIGPAEIVLSGPIRVRGDVSSQFLTALLMALPLTGREAVIEMSTELISKPYIEITLNLMARFGVRVERDGWKRFSIAGGQHYVSPGVVHVEGDASGASYFLAAGAIGGGPVRVEGVGRDSIQGDIRFADALAQLGARIETGDNWIEARAPETGRLKAFDLDLNHIPDAAMTLAVAALFADGPCRLRNIASWRVKETDRIAAMATELRKLGAIVEEGADFLRVSPPLGRLTADAAIDTYDDHRMAMCFSLAALGGVPVRINDPKCVAKTFPDYFERYGRIVAPVIAIDGPSASGKGTVAARVAAALGFHYLDSGALYRLTALMAQRGRVALDDEFAVAALAAELPAAFEGERILLGGDDVTDAIRTEAISVGASKVAALPSVRAALLERQRAYGRLPGLVADGRDMGSVVFPQAAVKVFLTASAEARARRRYKQLIEKGMTANMRTLLQDLEERDARDAARSVAPLQQCEDAERVDTTPLGIDEAVTAVLDIVRRRLPDQEF